MLQLAALYIYPIKSMGGVCLEQAIVEERGFRYDRRFMLVSPDGRCLTQHRNHQMALLDVTIENECHLRVWHRHRPADVLELPLTIDAAPDAPTVPVHIWDSTNVAAVLVSPAADRWFSQTLNEPCSLVFMPSTTYRPVDPTYARHQERVSFADGYPFLLIGQASLDDLNQRSGQALEMRRFRPNMVVSGGLPYEEETWERLRIGRQVFYAGESCGRCMLTTLDPATAQKGPEPLRTLAMYRHRDDKLVFGQYMLAETWQSDGVTESGSDLFSLHVGQSIDVLSRQVVANEPYGQAINQ